jgi:hypothetical protein
MEYQYQLAIGLTQKIFNYYYRNCIDFIKDIFPSKKSKLEEKLVKNEKKDAIQDT